MARVAVIDLELFVDEAVPSNPARAASSAVDAK